jgi:hypothetical protein
MPGVDAIGVRRVERIDKLRSIVLQADCRRLGNPPIDLTASASVTPLARGALKNAGSWNWLTWLAYTTSSRPGGRCNPRPIVAAAYTLPSSRRVEPGHTDRRSCAVSGAAELLRATRSATGVIDGVLSSPGSRFNEPSINRVNGGIGGQHYSG